MLRFVLILAAGLIVHPARAGELAEPVCLPATTWLDHAPSMLRFVAQCGPRTWWHNVDDASELFKTNEIDGMICLTGHYYIPPIGDRQVCLADRQPVESGA